MNSTNILLSYNYASSHVDLTWTDILFGIENMYLSPDAAIEHAATMLAYVRAPSKILLELACLRKGESISPYIDELKIITSKETLEEAQEKMMYLLLNWVYENREHYSEPFEIVELIYSDFDYPKSISGFVRYMPISSDDFKKRHQFRDWQEHLYFKWNEYLEVMRGSFST